jgi:hypothetical protein
MYVDDLLLSIRARLRISRPDAFDDLLNDWDRDFLTSVASQVAASRRLSTNQGATLLKLIGRLRHPLIRHGMATDDDLDQMLRYPEYRQPLYPSVVVRREVRYLGDNILGFRFKANEMMAASIRAFGVPPTTEVCYNTALLPRPRFDWDHRLWLVPVLRHNVAAIIAFVHEYRFDIDGATLAYLRLARNSRDQSSAFAITNDVILANVCDDPFLAGWITEVSGGLTL